MSDKDATSASSAVPGVERGGLLMFVFGVATFVVENHFNILRMVTSHNWGAKRRNPTHSCDLGWNDPPMLAYESRLRYAHVRGPTLTKRVGLSWDSPPSNPSSGPPLSHLLSSSPPPTSSAPPPSLKFHKPLSQLPTSDPPTSLESSLGENKEEVSLTFVTSGFVESVNELYGVDKEKEKAELNKRLQLIESMWLEDKFCSEIRRRLGLLVEALREGKLDECDALQRSLMVDHTSACSPWMAAIRKLINAKRDKSTA